MYTHAIIQSHCSLRFLFLADRKWNLVTLVAFSLHSCHAVLLSTDAKSCYLSHSLAFSSDLLYKKKKRFCSQQFCLQFCVNSRRCCVCEIVKPACLALTIMQWLKAQKVTCEILMKLLTFIFKSLCMAMLPLDWLMKQPHECYTLSTRLLHPSKHTKAHTHTPSLCQGASPVLPSRLCACLCPGSRDV